MSAWKKWMLLPAGLLLIVSIVAAGTLGLNKAAVGSTEAVPSSVWQWLWYALGGSGVFSLPAVLTWIVNKFKGGGFKIPFLTSASGGLGNYGDLASALIGLARDPYGKAARRKFWLALASFALELEESTDKIPGVSGRIEGNGEIVIRCTLLVEETPAVEQELFDQTRPPAASSPGFTKVGGP